MQPSWCCCDDQICLLTSCDTQLQTCGQSWSVASVHAFTHCVLSLVLYLGHCRAVCSETDGYVRVCVQCSYHVCLKKREDNRRAVEEFADRWRSRGFHDTFQCFYDTNDPSRVIAEKMYTIADVVHSMTWPSLVVVICGLVFLRLQTLSSYWSAGQLVSRLRHHVTD